MRNVILFNMRNVILLILSFLFSGSLWAASQRVPAVEALLNRIGGKGASRLIAVELIDNNGVATQQRSNVATKNTPTESFTITSRGRKPCIQGTSVSAITAGINWYLNHYAHINLTWNNLTTDLSKAKLPVPTQPERHECNADFRYYLNYCTFGYSMSTWSWQRWQQEIDWMALHGVNMPLQIVGLDEVWRRLLVGDFGYSDAEAGAFVAGPAYQAWWGMNNLEGWGGPNPAWWYRRQQEMARLIVEREKELGMQPVLPGFSGMVPSNFQAKTGIACMDQGGWCGFQRPFIMDPTSPDFARVAARYYARLEEVMGKSDYYSMDPFHEGGRIASGQYKEGYRAIFDAMNEHCGTQARWVIQQWQWDDRQATSLEAVPAGRLIVLDLFSDGQPAFDHFGGYRPQLSVYCAIPNFGGRTGFFGRLPRVAREYFSFKKMYDNIRGIGAAPEAIEQTPIVYDVLFELAWMNQSPDVKEWVRQYAISRYGKEDAHAVRAWDLLRQSALNNTTNLQGPHEAVMCARPALEVNSVSTWGGSEIFYDQTVVQEAVEELMQADIPASQPNFSYDLCDLVRQVMSDRSKSLLQQVREAHEAGDGAAFAQKRDLFLSLILDVDKLLGTNKYFRLGYYDQPLVPLTPFPKGRAEEGLSSLRGSAEDGLWQLQFRTLITTWGDRGPCDGGLRDYSYRQWQGMLADYYYPRWRYFFDHNLSAPEGGWFQMEWDWAHDMNRRYSATPEGNTLVEAKRLMKKYAKQE